MDNTKPPVVDTDRIAINDGDIEHDLWVAGEINDQPGYTFKAQVFNVGSMYGINFGQISKLEVWREGETVCHFNRGWLERPATAEDRRAVDTIVSSFREHGSERSNDSRSREKDDPGHER
ncbi:hypothetical protein WGT02_03780 [Rhizobium sp. T1470]|uniref:DUF7678 domain-containing protein n=1 Tax=unclassified Rhizobium TaxID=2613769 RepID=UPI001AAEE025|nr:hypothetical protein [Rhizobium sp. T1473]MCA0800441.1 hypothetical protein [Rhizobium sp. T1473]